MRLTTLMIGVMMALPSVAGATGGARRVMTKAPADMATIPAGSHQRLYGSERVRIGRFALDREEVTRADFLAFVRTNREWRRSAVTRQNANHSYLADWTSDLDAGAELDRPVTSVSWFAANAYCKAQGKRLPSVDEWEFAAAAGGPEYFKRLIGIYAERAVNSRKSVSTGFRNIYGVRGLHDRAWEWTSDFKPEADPHHDHAALKGHVHTMSCASSAIGAANPKDYPAFMRYAVRAGLDRRSTMSTLGFRCAATLT